MDYQPLLEHSSAKKSEAEELRKPTREIRRQKRARKTGETTGHVVKDSNVIKGLSDHEKLDAQEDDDCSFDEESDGDGATHLTRKSE